MDAKYEAAPPTDFQSFFPYYLREHAHPLCRALHYIGTTLVIALAVYALAMGQLVYLWGLPVVGYFFAGSGIFSSRKTSPPLSLIRCGRWLVISKCICCLSPDASAWRWRRRVYRKNSALLPLVYA
jgi:hypothetical protein